MKGYVTINTDASYHSQFQLGAFAFWIKSDYGKITHCGVLKNKISNSNSKGATEAEIQCIINAFYILKLQKWEGIFKVIVNTDSLNAIRIFQDDKVGIKKYNLKWGGLFRDKFNKIKPTKCLIEFRHVPAHKNTDTPKAFINDWCDKQAKLMLWETINAKK